MNIEDAKPGVCVKVIDWSIGFTPAGKSKFPLNDVTTYHQPVFDDDMKGPMFDLNTRCMIISTLHKETTDFPGVHNWLLLLTDDGRLGWTTEYTGLALCHD